MTDSAMIWSLGFRRAGLAAGLFCAVAAGITVFLTVRRNQLEIIQSPRILHFKKQLVDEPKNEELKEQIRFLDAELRRQYAWLESRLAWGGEIIGGGLIVAMLCFAAAGALDRRKPAPPGRPHEHGWQRKRTNWTTLLLLGVSILLLGAGFVAGFAVRPLEIQWPPKPPVAFDWSRFRGPQGAGWWKDIPPLPGVDGAEVLWKSPVALPGHSSPVAMGNQIFPTGAAKTSRAVFCYQADTGELLWRRDIPRLPSSPTQPPNVYSDTGFAAATPCIDDRERLLFAVFANGDMAAVDFSGKIKWTKSLGLPDNMYGLATSLMMAEGQLIVQFDQAFKSGEDNKEISTSKLLAFEPVTGEMLWEIERPVRDSWTSPILAGDESSGRRIITIGDPWVIAYDPYGDVAWKTECMSGDVAPSPVADKTRVYVTMEGVGVIAIANAPMGDKKPGDILWKNTEDAYAPDITSPVRVGDMLLTLTTGGLLQAFSITDGKLLWEKDFEMDFNASPSCVGDDGSVLLLGLDGELILGKATAKGFVVEHRVKLGEKCTASPVFAPGRMVIRTQKSLLCVGKE